MPDYEDEQYCAECDEPLQHDPDGAPGTFIHANPVTDNNHVPMLAPELIADMLPAELYGESSEKTN